MCRSCGFCRDTAVCITRWAVRRFRRSTGRVDAPRVHGSVEITNYPATATVSFRVWREGLRMSANRSGGGGSFLDRSHTVAPANYNRFLVPPAALAVHLSIGQAYAFSTYNLPLTKLIGISQSAPGDWKLTQVGWIFSIG